MGFFIFDSFDEGTILHSACKRGILDAVKYFVEKGADMEAKDVRGITPLGYACRWGSLDVVKYLVAKGADMEAKDKINWTPLNFACVRKENLDIIKYLVAQGADVKMVNLDFISGEDIQSLQRSIGDENRDVLVESVCVTSPSVPNNIANRTRSKTVVN